MANGIARSPTAISATARDTTNRLVTFCKFELRQTAQQTRTFPRTARRAITTSRTIYASWECFMVFPSSSVHFLGAFIPQLLVVYLVKTCLPNPSVHGRVIMSGGKRKYPPQTTVHCSDPDSGSLLLPPLAQQHQGSGSGNSWNSVSLREEWWAGKRERVTEVKPEQTD